MIAPMHVAGRAIGPGEPVFLIAEAGVNHNGRLDLALELVDAAAAAGADAVKFQTWRTELAIGRGAPKAAYQRETTGAEESQFEMVRKLELPAEAFRALRDRAQARGLVFFSAPFDLPSVEALGALDVPLFKVASGEITNLPLLRAIGRQGRPVILSTGMATLGEVEEAVGCLRAAGADAVALLHALSNYPAPPEELNLRAIPALAAAFGLPVGLSDHTLGHEAALAAVALGACVIEKHLTLDRDLPGPDHRASLDPNGFRALVDGVRLVERALGDGVKRPMPSEMDVRAVARKSIVAARDLPAGARLGESDLAVKRPGTGLAPKYLPELVGRRLRRAVAADELLGWGDLEPPA